MNALATVKLFICNSGVDVDIESFKQKKNGSHLSIIQKFYKKRL